MTTSDTTPLLTLYVTDECPLCEEAEQLMRRLGQEMGFRLETTNIQGDESLYERFRYTVPVLAVDGEPVLSAPLDEGRVREALRERVK
jgi:glutaredoxin